MKNLPEAFLRRMKESLQSQFPQFVQSLAEPTPVSIRLNPEKKATIDGESVPWSAYGRYLSSRPSFTLDPLFHAGTYYVQEASSMFLEQAVKQKIDTNAQLNILDLSAAPGGKSTHLLSLIGKDSLLVSNEVIRPRASILSENLKKWGYTNCVVTNNDPRDFTHLSGFFDVIVIDAPCSGEGLFRKDAGSIEEWSPANVELCSSRQKRIIADIWPALKEGGLLIYCTCTYNRFENEENLQWIRERQNVVFEQLVISPEWDIEEISDNGITGYRFYPHRVKGEGFFLSVIRKMDSQPLVTLKAKKTLAASTTKILSVLQSWIAEPDKHSFFQHADTIIAISESKRAEIAFLINNLRIVHAGTALVSVKHDKLIPEHALALSINLNTGPFENHALGEQEAIQYLRRESIRVNNGAKGYQLVTYRDVPLGWINNLGNRANNLYPMDWRIRMQAPAKGE